MRKNNDDEIDELGEDYLSSYYYNKNVYNNYNQNYSNNKNDITERPVIKEKQHLPKRRIFLIIIITVIVTTVLMLGTFAVLNTLTTYAIAFELNGATSVKDAPVKCTSNVFGHCYVTLPYATRENGEILGYNYLANGTTVKYKEGEKIELMEDTVLYVISKEDKKLVINSSSVDEVDNSNLSCTLYNKDDSCKVDIPQFNKKGYVNLGYAKEQNGTKAEILPGDTYDINDNTEIYPVYDQFSLGSYGKTSITDVKKTIKLNKGYVDITSSCPDNISDKYIEHIKVIEQKYPYAFRYSKIVLIGRNDFDKVFHSNSNVGGLTLKYPESPTVFMPCDTNDADNYGALFHELMHVFDMKMEYYSGKSFSNNSLLTNIYKKYGPAKNRPLRAYAYANLQEFFAELMTYYYFNHVDTVFNEKGIVDYHQTLPDDIIKSAEYYICVGNNNYDSSKCSI